MLPEPMFRESVAYPGEFSGCPEPPPPPAMIFFKLEGLHPYMHRPSPAT